MKLWSGRFWLTIITGGVFAYSVYARIMPEEAIAAIVVMVFQGYFLRNRSDRGGGGEKKET